MILKQRMFRVKPYTRCIDCTWTDHIKCKKCMDKLVNDIIATKDNGTPKHILRRSPILKHIYLSKYPLHIDFKKQPFLFKHSKSMSSMIQGQGQKANDEKKFEIYSKYDLWMKNVSRRHQGQQEQQMKATISQWPIKKRDYLSTADMNRNQGKFEGCEKKFFERIRNSQRQHVIDKERLTRTVLNKLRLCRESVVK